MSKLITSDDVTRRKPHLLYVAWSYPPSRSAGMYRALATANAFVEQGWKVTVLTATREIFELLNGGDPDAEARIDRRVSVLRVPFALDRGEPDLARWSRVRANLPLWWSLGRSVGERRRFPETFYGSWYRPLVNAAAQVHNDDPVSLVVGSANPNVDFAPGAHLFRTHGVPYVMDYRDAWHLNVYTGKPVGPRWSRSARVERRMLRNAAEVWFVNQPILDWHAVRYPDNAKAFHVVANGFDANFLDQSRTRVRYGGDRLVFGYLGTIYGPMPLRQSLAGWRLARKQSDLVARSRLIIRGHLGHYSTPDPALLGTIEEFTDDAVSYGGPVSKGSVAGVYDGFDALLLALVSSQYITSGKVFEYAATGLPITSVHEKDSAASAVLRDHPSWHPSSDMGAQAIASAFIKTAEHATTITAADVVIAQQWAAQLSREKQLNPRIEALRDRVR